MNIGFFPLHTFIRPGGVKRHVLALHREFQKRGLSSKIAVPRRSLKEHYGKDIFLLCNSIEIPFGGSRADFTLCLNPNTVKKFLAREKFDILHFHNFALHTIQILEHSNGINILTFHSNIEGSKILSSFPFLVYNFRDLVLKKIHGIICVSPLQLKFFSDCHRPIRVIPNGVDLKGFHPGIPPIKKWKDGKFNILFLGRVEERKGLIYLLRAFQLLKKDFSDLRLLVVGEGPLLPECKRFVKEHKLPDVVFENLVEEGKVASYYATCDIFVSPAVWGESFGMVLLEAMACGKPVVAFANEGYKGVLTGKGSQALVKPKDWYGLAEKIRIFIENKAKRRELRLWGLREAKKYAWEKVADEVLRFYDDVRKIQLK